MDYARTKPAEGIIFELRIDLGKCKTLEKDDPMMKTWQEHGYDSAFAPKGANDRGLEENCVADPRRIKIVRASAGHTGKLLKMGMGISDDGKLVKIEDLQSFSSTSPVDSVLKEGNCKDCKKAVWSNQERSKQADGSYVHKGCQMTKTGICDVAGCSRATWNGNSGEQCCRTCKASDGARHGPDCEAKAKAAAVGLSSSTQSPSRMKIGDRVRVRQSVVSPKYGWGTSVDHESSGALKRIDDSGDVIIDFPKHSGWKGRLEEIEADDGMGRMAKAVATVVGSKVTLTKNYANFADARDGPLNPGLIMIKLMKMTMHSEMFRIVPCCMRLTVHLTENPVRVFTSFLQGI